jgi:Domain of unknown function (DUF4287)/Domain of unknown function (DUF5655)
MTSVEDGIAAQIRNIEARYGKPLQEWFGLIAASGLTRHAEVVAMLKADYGMAHGAAHRVSLLSRQPAAAEAAPAEPGALADALYTGKKAALRPLHDQLMAMISTLGLDVGQAPKKGYISLRRPRKQFAMIQPSAAGRIDLGLILPGTPSGGRLEPSGSFNALFTHRVRVTAAGDLDDELAGWLTAAYTAAG